MGLLLGCSIGFSLLLIVLGAVAALWPIKIEKR